MLPYTIMLLVTLTIMLYAFWFMDIPLGLQADYVYPRRMYCLKTNDKGASALESFLDVLEVRRRQLPFTSATLLARLGLVR